MTFVVVLFVGDKQLETFLLLEYTTGWHRLVYVETYAGHNYHNMIDMGNY